MQCLKICFLYFFPLMFNMLELNVLKLSFDINALYKMESTTDYRVFLIKVISVGSHPLSRRGDKTETTKRLISSVVTDVASYHRVK